MNNPLIEKLDKEFYETDFEPSWMSSSMEVSKTKLKSYLHSRDQALIEGIEEAINNSEIFENPAEYNDSEFVRTKFIQILNSFKPKR